MKAFVIDLSICHGCYNCQISCKDEHVGNDWSPYAKPQPDTGQFWGRIEELVRGTVPKVKVAYTFIPCQHCVDAPCIQACAVEGALYQREDGLVIIDSMKCTGCQNCVDACPYGCIFYNESLHLSQKCTGCAHLLDEGWTDTRCSDACPTAAIKFGDESALDLSGAETLHPEYELTTRAYYKNLPKRFIGGTVYDPAEKEVVIGATCTLSGDSSGTATTDGFGDFWFEGLDVGNFTVTIEADGYPTKTIDPISTEKDVNLGDIAIS